MNLFFAIFFLVLFSGSLELAVAASTLRPINPGIDQRLWDLEKRVSEIDLWYAEHYNQTQGKMAPFFSEKISFGGFFETAVLHISGPDTLSQTSANSHALGINLAAEFNEKNHFVSQVINVLSYPLENEHNNPGLSPSQREFVKVSFYSLLAQGYMEFNRSEALIVQVGLGYTPFGYSFQQREPVLFRRKGGPLMLSSMGQTTVGIAFPLWQGIHLHGSTSATGRERFGYNLYSFTPSVNPKDLGEGARLWWTDSEIVTAGISFQSGKQVNTSYSSYGADINLKMRNFGLLTEYARVKFSQGSPDLTSYYAEPYYVLSEGRWVIFAVGDYINNPNLSQGAISDAHEKWLTGFGVNWLPIPNSRLRLVFSDHDYRGVTETIIAQRRDYQTLEFSAGLAF